MKRTPNFQAFNEAHVDLFFHGLIVYSCPPTQILDSDDQNGEKSGLRIFCKHGYWRSSKLVHVLTSLLASLFPSAYIVEHLHIHSIRGFPMSWRDLENMQWSELFRPFTSVRNLYLYKKLIVPALQDSLRGTMTDKMTDVFNDALPALEFLFFEEPDPSGPVQEAIGQFVAVLIGHPVGISPWKPLR